MQRPTHHPQEVLRGANRMRSAAPSSKRLQVRIFLLGISAALEIGESERLTGLWGLCQEALMLQNLSFTLVKIQHFSGNVSLTLVQSFSYFCILLHTFALFCAAFFRGDLQLSRARRAQPTREPLEIR